MAYTIYGFGTRFFGEGDLRPDGSFITTEWVTAANIPIIPLRSFRLARAPDGTDLIPIRSQSYVLFERLPICWPQVGRIYAFIGCAAAWWAAMGWLFIVRIGLFGHSYIMILIFPIVAVMAVPFGAVWWFRRKAYRERFKNGTEPGPLR